MTARLHSQCGCTWSIGFAAVLVLVAAAHAAEQAELGKPKVEGRPVYLVHGKVVVFPEGIEKSPRDYKGAINVRPLALIKIDGTIVGEVYSARLKGAPSAEAKDMATSADDSEHIVLQKRGTIQDDGDTVEVVTLKIDLESKLGRPWIIHSLYFPQGQSSVTFKLVASEKRFKSLLPYFETMLTLNSESGTPRQ